MSLFRRGASITVTIAAGALFLVGCGTTDSMDNQDSEDRAETIVIGSQDYYSNEIIAEIYAQALEQRGLDVQRDFRIGQREVYMPEVEDGKIDLFPEYSGNLLQYYDASTTARTSEEVYSALESALPDGISILEQSSATDQDSYNVTSAFAAEHNVRSLADLANINEPITLGGNSELETRPYGPQGLKATYGVEVAFTPIEDSGGPLTIAALRDGNIQVANIYSADPRIAEQDLVTLDDPEGLFLAANIVPIISQALPDEAKTIINEVNAQMTPAILVSFNVESTSKEMPAADIASAWLATWFD